MKKEIDYQRIIKILPIIVILAAILIELLKIITLGIKYLYFHLPLNTFFQNSFFQITDLFNIVLIVTLFFVFTWHYYTIKTNEPMRWKKGIILASFLIIIYAIVTSLLTCITNKKFIIVNQEYVLIHKLAKKEGKERGIITNAYIDFAKWEMWINRDDHQVILLENHETYEHDFSRVHISKWDK